MIARHQRYQEIAQGLFIFSSSRDWGQGGQQSNFSSHTPHTYLT
ncbi:hypothetical protein [Fischerella thermalis]|nr:hypothetical protein [Fischerella thermalis]